MGLSPKARRKARLFAIQVLYQRHFSDQDIADIIMQFRVANDHHKKTDWEFFEQLLHGMVACAGEMDSIIEPLIDRTFAEINPIELIILRLGAYEITHCPDIPKEVTINEYVDLAKEFGAEEGHKFINGILDKISS